MSNKTKRGKVWLAVGGLVKSSEGNWLVVKKRYGGLKGKWSLPAGFVEEGETADEAVVREVKEETDIDCVVKGLIGLRTGVISDEISDNLLVFLLEPLDEGKIKHQENELYEARFIAPEDLLLEKEASIMLHFLIKQNITFTKPGNDELNPGDQFNYSAYKLFF
ncbi:NUDIX hydrolase [Neobacillus niacini]|uniref:NUDIX domain-containing protein n=1 Tax=Neobacillus niacini TaxID=86668 RepID=UPI00052FD5CD|nr:NUDIX hydrolase [Neobacillus niacini]KGM45592.1 NUDIX hydrolase [Neobacillus niacini]MEC1523587.1 NUDIX hydrolase [Neobacillus niacini]